MKIWEKNHFGDRIKEPNSAQKGKAVLPCLWACKKKYFFFFKYPQIDMNNCYKVTSGFMNTISKFILNEKTQHYHI